MGKNLVKYVGGILLFLVIALSTLSSALALEVPTDLALGSPDQERNTEFSTNFVIKNDGVSDLDNITLENTLSDLLDLTFTGVPTSLTPSESATITLTAKLPLWFDAVDDNLEEKAFDLGTITIKADGVSDETIAVTGQAVNKLDVRDFDIGSEEKGYEGVNDGETIDLKANEGFDFLLEVRNDFNDGPRSAEDIGLADIDIKVRFEIIVDDDDDKDNDIVVGRRAKISLLAEETDELFIEGFVDREARGTYDLIARIEGTDDNGALHGEQIHFTLKIDRKRHEITIDDIRSSVTNLICNRVFTLSVDYSNIGTKNEDQIMITASNHKLGISEKEKDLYLRDGDQGTHIFTIDVTQEVLPGTYAIEVQTFFNNKYISDEEYLLLDVQDCALDPVEEVVEEPVEPEEPVDETPEEPVETPEEPEEVREPLADPEELSVNQLLIVAMMLVVALITASLSLGYAIGKR